ncbi:MAG: molybdopterin-dependent oxidoreductase [Thermoleophilia bacterium]
MDEKSDKTEMQGAAHPPADSRPSAGAGAGPQVPPPRVRYSRKRFLVLVGALVAGFAGALEALRRLAGGGTIGGSGASDGGFGPFPVRSVEDVPDVPAEQWVLAVDGLVRQPLRIDAAAWRALPRRAETVDFHCVEGWSVDDVPWGGVAPAVLLEQAGLEPEANYVVFHARSGVYTSSLPLELVTHPRTMLADTLAGEPLPPDHGGPLRLVVPVQLGYKNVKWVTRLEVTAAARPGYWESRGYPENAPVTDAGSRFGLGGAGASRGG